MTITLDLHSIRQLLFAYNSGYYAPARSTNLVADARAYELFRGGIQRDRDRLLAQLVFIGKDFGGAKVVPFVRVAECMADRVLADRGYHEFLESIFGLNAAPIPNESVQRAMAPFVGLPREVGNKRNFQVWGSKMLHFARSDAFPIMDGLAQLALGIAATVEYDPFVREYRVAFLRSLCDLKAATDVDPHSPTLLRRFDKVLYQRGLELKGRA